MYQMMYSTWTWELNKYTLRYEAGSGFFSLWQKYFPMVKAMSQAVQMQSSAAHSCLSDGRWRMKVCAGSLETVCDTQISTTGVYGLPGTVLMLVYNVISMVGHLPSLTERISQPLLVRVVILFVVTFVYSSLNPWTRSISSSCCQHPWDKWLCGSGAVCAPFTLKQPQLTQAAVEFVSELPRSSTWRLCTLCRQVSAVTPWVGYLLFVSEAEFCWIFFWKSTDSSVCCCVVCFFFPR